MTINLFKNTSEYEQKESGAKGGGVKNSTFNNVCLNTFGLCKPSNLIQRWRYVNTNIKTKGLSSMLNFVTKSPIVLAFLIPIGMLFQIKVPE